MALKDISDKTKAELAARITDLETLIAKKGLGSKYVSKVEKMQRRLNVVLFLGVTTVVAGVVTWMAFKSDEDG